MKYVYFFSRPFALQTLTVASITSMWNNAVNAWWSIVFYPATDAPQFRKGMIAMLCACIATLVITWVVYALERREWRHRAVSDEIDPDEKND